MIVTLALAAAIEIGQAADPSLKPCADERAKPEKLAPKTAPNYRAMTRIRKLPEAPCPDAGRITSLFTSAIPIDYSPIPDEETFAAAQMPLSASPGSSIDAETQCCSTREAEFVPQRSGAAAFISYPIAIYRPIPPAPELPKSIALLVGLGALGLYAGRPRVLP